MKKPRPRDRRGRFVSPGEAEVAVDPATPTAAEVIRWLEALKVTKGPLVGEKLSIMPFQRQVIEGILSHSEVAFTVARGNGKTTLIAAIGAAVLLGPMAIPYAEVVVVASSLQQATIAFNHTKRFLESLGHDLTDNKLWRLSDNDHHRRIECRENGASLRCIGSNPKKAHGLDPVLVMADEPSQWEENHGPAMYAALVTALGKQKNATLVAMGTRPKSPDHWFAQMLRGGPGMYVQWHAAEDDADDFAPESINAANPALPWMPWLGEAIEREAEKARLYGGPYLASFRALRLNKGTSDVAQPDVIVRAEEWAACASDKPDRRGPLAIGFDLGEASSMTAYALYWPSTGWFEAHGAFPSDPDLAERGLLDFVGDLYVRMASRGEIRTYPGKVTPVFPFFRDMLKDVEGHEVIGVVADRYRQKAAEQALATLGVSWNIDWRGVGRGKDGIYDIHAFQTEILEGRLQHGESLLMTSAIEGSRLERDTNGNPRLDRRGKHGRIDALQAAVLGAGLGRSWRLPSPEEDGDLIKYYAGGETVGAWSV